MDRAGRHRTMTAIAAVAGVLVLAGCTATPTVDSVRTLPTGSGPAPTLTNAGTQKDIALVKRSATDALSAELHIFDVDERGTPLTAKAQRTKLVDATTSGAQAARLRSALINTLGKPPFRRGGHFVVDHWDGIQVVDDHARAFVSGHSTYIPTAADPQKRDGTWQYQLLLTRLGDGWRVTRERAAANDQG